MSDFQTLQQVQQLVTQNMEIQARLEELLSEVRALRHAIEGRDGNASPPEAPSYSEDLSPSLEGISIDVE